jgi:hypothetical protein
VPLKSVTTSSDRLTAPDHASVEVVDRDEAAAGVHSDPLCYLVLARSAALRSDITASIAMTDPVKTGKGPLPPVTG